ncbi:hypothetical protein [Desulfoluna spongiiphila]|nr:hypothetical protein [Desulfoluna spongiiphila]
MDQWEAMISHWLGQEAAEDLETFAGQVARAEWLEKRHLESLQRLIGGVS